MTALFVMPHHTSNFEKSRPHLEEAINSVLLQTDGDWKLCIIDDNSTDGTAIDYLRETELKYQGKIFVIFNQ